MPQTASGLRYPTAGSAPNVPQDLQNLANDVERELGYSTGFLPIIGGWEPYANGQFAPGWHLSREGVVTLRGMVRRTASSFFADKDVPYQFIGTLPASIQPSQSAPQPSYAGFAGGRLPILLQIGVNISMQTYAGGEATMEQNTGFVSLNGVTWYL